MEKSPKESRQDIEARYYTNVNMFANERIGLIDPNLSARIVSVEKEPGLQDVKTYNDQKNVLLISSTANPDMEWTIHIPFEFSKLEEYLDAFEKDYQEYKSGRSS